MPHDASRALLEVEGLQRYYAARRVLNVHRFTVSAGETLVVLGPSGAGKSVLLRILNLLEPPSAGTVRYNGEEVFGASMRRRLRISRSMAMIFQSPLLFKRSVFDNVAYGLKVRGVSTEEVSRRVADALDLVGLSSYSGADARTLSGGEAQRVSVARALVLEPEILFLDEPFANLDAPIRFKLQDDLKGILESRGIASIFVTHDQDEAARMGERIILLNNGEIEQDGLTRELFFSPANEFVARFLGVRNLYRGTVNGCSQGACQIESSGVVIEAAVETDPGTEVLFGIRPEEIDITGVNRVGGRSSNVDADENGPRNRVDGVITGIEFRGPLATVTLGGPLPIRAVITRRSCEESCLSLGNVACASFRATSVIVIPG